MSMAPQLILVSCLAASCSVALQTASNNDPAAEKEAAMTGERVCEPVADGLDADATLSDRAGRYRLTLVVDASGAPADSGSTKRHVVTGLLTLRRQVRDQGDQGDPGDPDDPGDPGESDPTSDTVTPIFGFTDLDPRSVGAHRVGDPGSEDPAAPGVLVLERSEYGRRIITLRLGSDANRRDLVRYDGDYTALRVHKIDEDGFSGSWRSGGGSGWT